MHQTNKTISLVILLMAMISCIKPFDPFIESGAEHKFVVSGCITDVEGYQTVNISISSPVEEPGIIPLSGCYVRILSDIGKVFDMQESGPGEYTVWMESADLLPGTSYQVEVSTPTGEVLTSDFDKMPESPPVDAVYYRLEDHPTSNPSVNDRGIQFYTDLHAGESQSRYYRWEVTETWEYHAAHAKEFYYDGNFHGIEPPDSSTWKCWSTHKVKDIFTLSTLNLSQNAYQQYPLHFVNGKTSRLSVLYSFLLRQYALSETAYNYWEQLRINSYEQIGLYEKQPMDIKGNVRETSGTGQEVLGLFYAASLRTKRIFIPYSEGVEMDYFNFCNELPLGHFGWDEFLPKEFPVWFYIPLSGGLLILTDECVECTMAGGTTTKPDFWPQ